MLPGWSESEKENGMARELTSSDGCHEIHLTSWVCSIRTLRISKSESGWTVKQEDHQLVLTIDNK
jgi:hypothetical protein